MNIGKLYNVTQLGSGGMGTVYSGYLDGKKVAIKKFREEFISQEELINRFRLEAQILKRLNHPSIVRIIEPPHDPNNPFYPAFMEHGELYLIMEFVEGETLDTYVKTHGGFLSEEHAVHIMCNILDAMEYVRQNGIIHRDIKPSNIIIRPDGLSVCIIDFGIVKDLNSKGLTIGRCVIGTDGYMSPEQANGLTVDSRTDIYSLGCVLFYMLTGTHAIQKKASDYETRMAILQDAFPKAKDFNPLISDRIQSIIDKAVNKNMLLRFQSPAEFKKELEGGRTVVETNNPEVLSISIGRGQDCDITIYDPQEKVSRHHLIIQRVACSSTERAASYEYHLIDRSTNGTIVNGTLLKCNHQISILDQPHSPQIILANAIKLDWNQVLDAFNKNTPPSPVLDPGPNENPPNPAPSTEEKLSFGYGLLSFLFPIVGWVLYYQWRQNAPQKAKKANRIAWIGFIISLLINMLTRISE